MLLAKLRDGAAGGHGADGARVRHARRCRVPRPRGRDRRARPRRRRRRRRVAARRPAVRRRARRPDRGVAALRPDRRVAHGGARPVGRRPRVASSTPRSTTCCAPTPVTRRASNGSTPDRHGPSMIEAFFVAFGTVFLAELPDKTMVASLVLTTRYRRPFAVWVGVSGAFVFHVVLAVSIGSLLRRLPEQPVQLVVAVLFLVGGVILLRGRRGRRDRGWGRSRVVPHDRAHVGLGGRPRRVRRPHPARHGRHRDSLPRRGRGGARRLVHRSPASPASP